MSQGVCVNIELQQLCLLLVFINCITKLRIISAVFPWEYVRKKGLRVTFRGFHFRLAGLFAQKGRLGDGKRG